MLFEELDVCVRETLHLEGRECDQRRGDEGDGGCQLHFTILDTAIPPRHQRRHSLLPILFPFRFFKLFLSPPHLFPLS